MNDNSAARSTWLRHLPAILGGMAALTVGGVLLVSHIEGGSGMPRTVLILGLPVTALLSAAICLAALERIRLRAAERAGQERRRLDEQRLYLAAIVESSDDAILGKDLSGVILSWNPGAERIYGYSAAEIIGRSISVLCPPERVGEPHGILERIGRGERVDHYETERMCKDGRRIQVSLTISPIRDAEERIRGASTIARDVSERRHVEAALEASENLLRSVIDSSTDLIFMKDRDLRIVLCNQAYASALGKPVAGIHGKSDLELGWDRELVEGAAAKGIPGWQRDDRTALSGEIVHVTSEPCNVPAGTRFFDTVKAPVRDARGEIVGLVGVSRDVTERVRAEREIQQLNAGLERRVAERTAELTAVNQELESFNYSVSHDLRAPLRHIDGYSKILLDTYSQEAPEDARRCIDRIRTGAQRMGHMVDELLELSRTSRREVRKELTCLATLVEDAIGELKPEIGDRAIEWHIAPLPFADCDPALTRQVFANLLSNAVKFSRRRELAVIEAGQTCVEGQTVFFVRDNGVGFSMKYADKLFGVFQRLHRREDFEGTGVGLVTVQRIIQKHGGRIWAEAELEKGATFYFTLEGRGEQQRCLTETTVSGER